MSDDGVGARRETAPPERSVAQEAALLVDLLSQRGGWGPGTDRRPGSDEDGSERHRAPDDHGRHEGHQGGAAHECTCGGQAPQACRYCPVCQVIGFVQRVNPETIERVADFALFAATALRDLATAQRERTDTASGAASDPDPGDHPEDSETPRNAGNRETPGTSDPPVTSQNAPSRDGRDPSGAAS